MLSNSFIKNFKHSTTAYHCQKFDPCPLAVAAEEEDYLADSKLVIVIVISFLFEAFVIYSFVVAVRKKQKVFIAIKFT